MDFTYVIILAAVLIASPFVLKIAVSQSKEAKRRLKVILLILLSAQMLLGFLNWENFSAGRSGFELSFAYPASLLGLFFIISTVQIILLFISKTFNNLIVVLNFTNSIVIFMGMIRLSNILGFQIVSFAAVGAVFLALIGNVLGLIFINKDRDLLKKYLR